MSERFFISPEQISTSVESYQTVFANSQRIENIEALKFKEHLALPYPFQNYDLLAINVPSTYQQGEIPDGEEPPWGILRVVATARETYGFNAGILDAHRLKLSPVEIREQIIKCGARLVGLNPTSVNVFEARVIADICTDLKVPFILGGVHATLDPRIAKEDFPEAYAIIRGSGELAIKEVLDVFHNGTQRSQNNGIYYYDQDIGEGSFYAKKMKPEEVPLVHQEKYIAQPIYNHMVEISGKPQNINEATLLVTSGCPFECTFCSSPVMVNRNGDVPYLRPEMERIVSEVQNVLQLGADAIHFLDDMAFITGQNIKDFYKGLSDRNLLGDFIWRGLTRAPVILRPDFDNDVMRMMKESGAWKVALGIESGNDEVLRKIKKQINTDQVRRAVSKLSASDIQVKGFFIFGFPGETEAQMDDTLQFINELKKEGLTEINVFQFKPYPGTQEYVNLIKKMPDLAHEMGYSKIKHTELDGKARERADNHVWLSDDIRIANTSSRNVRRYVEQALEDFYGASRTSQPKL